MASNTGGLSISSKRISRWFTGLDWERVLSGVFFNVIAFIAPFIVVNLLMHSEDQAIRKLLDPKLTGSILGHEEGITSLIDLSTQLYTLYIALGTVIFQSLYFLVLPDQEQWAKRTFLLSFVVSFIFFLAIFFIGWVESDIKLEDYRLDIRQPLIGSLYMPPFPHPVFGLRIFFLVWGAILGFIAGRGSTRRNTGIASPATNTSPGP